MRKPPFAKRTASRKQVASRRLANQFPFASRKGPSPLEQAKAVITINELWARLGFEGKPSKSCRCPWREDKKPSFSVRSDGRLWNDYSTGQAGDAVSFLQCALNVTPSQAAKRFIEMAGGTSVEPLPAKRQTEPEPKPETLPTLPAMHKGTHAELHRLADLRGIVVEAIHLASEVGHLRFCEYRSLAAWIVTDSTGRNAHTRRMDGLPWWKDGPKSLAFTGIQAGWPIGAADIGDRPAVGLVEGEPDLMAAWGFIYAENRSDVAPVAMLGASNRIHAEALPFFADKVVKVFAHSDAKGQGMAAAIRWAGQLKPVARSVSIMGFDGLTQLNGRPVTDLNELLHLDLDEWENLPDRHFLPSPNPCQQEQKGGQI